MKTCLIKDRSNSGILVPRGRAPFGQHQKSRPLARRDQNETMATMATGRSLRKQPGPGARQDGCFRRLYRPLRESVVRMRATNLFHTAVQTNKTSPIKQKNKRNVLSCLIECLMSFKSYQTRPNTIKQHQTRWPNGIKCLVTKQCLMVFGRQTFPV